jgi:hypothetical protein
VFRPVQFLADGESAQVDCFRPGEIALRHAKHADFVERERDAEMPFAESLLADGERAGHRVYRVVEFPAVSQLVGLLHQFQHLAESLRLFRRDLLPALRAQLRRARQQQQAEH